MSIFSDSYSLSNEDLNDDERLGLNLARSREFCKAMVEDGAWGHEIIYAMVYAAVEAGLTQTGNGFYIFPRVSQAISDAGFNAQERAEKAVEDAAALDDHSSNIIPFVKPPGLGDTK
jgi:hypothetical protein